MQGPPNTTQLIPLSVIFPSLQLRLQVELAAAGRSPAGSQPVLLCVVTLDLVMVAGFGSRKAWGPKTPLEPG